MNKKLLFQAAVKFFFGVVLVFLLLFLPAGTIHFPNGWLLICLLFIPMLVLGLILWAKAPELLAKRLNTKEKESTQRTVVALSALLFLAGFIVAGLDYRFGWSHLPRWLVAGASVIFLAAYGLYWEVMRENAYLSRTVEVQEDQAVIDTGLYGIIRHPMYSAAILLFLMLPLVLSSGWAFLIFLCYPIILIRRIGNEEQVLTAQLPGYRDYCKKVRYRLLPRFW